MPKLRSYLRRALNRAYHETAAFTKGKLLISAVMALLTRFTLWELSAKNKIGREIVLDLMILAGCYVAVSIGAFIVNLFRAPALLDAECQREIARLSQQLELPDKARADHLRFLLSKLGKNGRAVLEFALFREEINYQHMTAGGLSDETILTGIRECIDAGLLIWRNDNPSSMMSWVYDVYWIPPDFRTPLRTLFYAVNA